MSRQRPAHVFFFPAAALYAMLALPVSVLSMGGGQTLVPGLATATGHGHEMLFGFALAVMAGFLLPRASTLQIWMLAGLWLLARAAGIADPGGLPALLLNIAFAGLLAAETAPRFIRAAKKWRNQVFGPVLVAIAAAVAAYQLASFGGAWEWRLPLLHVGVLLFSLAMFFMGGRIMAPAAAGHLEGIGETLDARVQPRIEGAVLVLLVAAMVMIAIPQARLATAGALCAAGVLVAIRVFRWRPWRYQDRPDLAGMAAGYGWLALGLVLMGAAIVIPGWAFREALHAVTVGALGSLTISVMARTRLQRARLDVARPPGIPLAIGLVTAAAVLRTFASLMPFDPWHAWWLAALAWALAFALLARLLWRVPAG